MKRFLLLPALLFSFAILAGNPNKELAQSHLISSRMEMVESAALQLQIDNPLQKELQLKVSTQGGVLMLKHQLEDSASYNGRYELNALNPGTYVFTLYLNGELIDEKTVEVQ